MGRIAVLNTDAGEVLLDYRICQYGQSRAAFRGPKKAPQGSYVAVIGGSECFGKFVESPFPDLLEAQLGEPVVNLGVMHAGLTLIADDPAILPVAAGARMTVVQVLGAQNMSNRYYSVHPRRNDRFVAASYRLQRLFPDVDFTDFNFTGHLLTTLEAAGGPGYARLLEELRTAWVSRMRLILEAIPGEKVLLWMSRRRPEDGGMSASGHDPMFVDRDMLEGLSPYIAGIVEAVADTSARDEGVRGKVFAESERQAAAAMPGPLFHAQAAAALVRTIADPSLSPGLAAQMRRPAE